MTDVLVPADFHTRRLAQQADFFHAVFGFGMGGAVNTDGIHGEYLARLLGIPPGYCGWDRARQLAWWFWSEEAWHPDLPSVRNQLDDVNRLITNAACQNPEAFGLDDPNDNVAMLAAVGDFAFDLGLFGGPSAFINWKRAHPTTAVASYVGQQAGAALGGAVGPAGQVPPNTRVPGTPTPRATRARGPRRVPRRRRRPSRVNTSRPRGQQISLVTHSLPETPAVTAATAAPVWPWYVAGGIAALGLGYLAYRATTTGRDKTGIRVRDARTGRSLYL